MRTGLIAIESWAGRREQWVEVVGETATRYRIRAITLTRLPGRRHRARLLAPGETGLVPKHAVRLQGGP